MKLLVTWFAVSFAVLGSVFAEFFANEGFIYDSSGRVNFFHGTNFINKGFPWYPEVLLSDENVQQMASWGFNTVRLGVMWTGVNPQQGVFNETYISIIEDILTRLELNGIRALVDVHQDVISSYFCLYDGAPTWIIDKSNSSTHPFPYPLDWDGTNPCPYERAWGKNYFAEQTGAAFQDLYHNTNGMRDYFGRFWGKVVASFKEHDILGWEILNEPWAGNIYAQPSLLLPGVAGRDNLQPFYDEVVQYIRAEDASHLVFYEPVTWGMILNGTLTGSGFTAVPGGAQYANKSVFSFHYYCWWYGNGGEFNRQTCDHWFGPKVFDQVAEDVKMLGGAGMLTEWGQGCQYPSNNTGECDPIMDLADSRLSSWIDWYWQGELSPEWNPSEAAIDTYSRTFAHAVAGTPSKMRYDSASHRFELCYAVNTAITEPTVIYVNNALHYPSGVKAVVLGSAARSMRVEVGEASSNRVFVHYEGGVEQARGDTLSACVLLSPL